MGLQSVRHNLAIEKQQKEDLLHFQDHKSIQNLYSLNAQYAALVIC